MELILGLAILAFLGWSLYKSGKRTGSRQGYNVGRSRARRYRRR